MMLEFESPASFSLSGSTGSGKSTWIFKLLKHSKLMMKIAPHRILYCYGVWQDLFNEMEKTIPNISFHEGVPSAEQINNFADGNHNIIILDDLMTECIKNNDVELLFTRGMHHKKLSVIYLNQNLYAQGKYSRNITLNTFYLIIFQNLRDRSQIQKLGQQLFPGQGEVLMEAYKDCMQNKFGYLVIDLAPHTDHQLRLRTEIFPNEITKIYHGKK